MDTLRELVHPEWMTLEEAAEYLRVSRQAAGQAAIRLSFGRRRVGHMVLLSRYDVELYRRSRRPTGPRKPPTSA